METISIGVEKTGIILLIITATLITAIATIEAGYVTQLKDKLRRMAGKDQPAQKRFRAAVEDFKRAENTFRFLLLGFYLFSLAAWLVFLTAVIISFTEFMDQKDVAWVFITFTSLLLFMGWTFLIIVAVISYSWRDPAGVRDKNI